MRQSIASLLSLAVTLSASNSAFARERVAVLILPVRTTDAALADNLTEVAISRLAELSDYELVGTRELRRRLALTGGTELPIDCLSEAACLGRVGMIVGVRRLVSGSVRPEGTRFLVALALNDIESGKVESSFFRAVDGGLDSLIRTIQEGVDDLFQHRPTPGQLRFDSTPDGAAVVVDETYRGTTPLWVHPLEPGTHHLRVELAGRFPWKKEVQLAAGQELLISVDRDELTPRRAWAPYAAYGTGAAAVLAFAAAGLFGTLARVDPTGRTRGDVQMDLDVRKTYATITNVLVVTGATLAGLSALTFVRMRRDIAGE